MKKKLIINLFMTFSFLLAFVSISAAKSLLTKEGQKMAAVERNPYAGKPVVKKESTGKWRNSYLDEPAPKTVSSSELVEKNRFFNNKTVWYQGEVIGDIMVRGNLAWLTVNDDAYSRQDVKIRLKGYNSGLPVTLPKNLTQQIKFVGNYKQHGDVILVKAVFHNACPEHNGALMLHAKSLKVVKPGFIIKHKVSAFKLRLAALSFLLFLLSVGVYYLKTPALKRRWFS